VRQEINLQDGAPTPRGWGGEGRGAARRAPSVAPRHRRAYVVYVAARAADGGGGVGASGPCHLLLSRCHSLILGIPSKRLSPLAY
jgi:hypothetical protein